MAASQDDVIQVTDAIIEIDVTGDADFVVSTAMECDLSELTVSGGDFVLSNFQALCGNTYIIGQSKNPRVLDSTAVYTDGATPTDLHDVLWDTFSGTSGDRSNVAVRYQPFGAGSGFDQFVFIGFLNQVTPPNLPDGTFSFQLTASSETKTAIP